MNEQIEQIIRELLEIDLSLQGQEASMKKTIEKLLSARPDTGLDEAYKAELKAELLKQFARKKAPQVSSKRICWGLAATLLVGVVALSVWFVANKELLNEIQTSMPLPPSSIDHSVVQKGNQVEKLSQSATQTEETALLLKKLNAKKDKLYAPESITIEGGIEGGVEGGVVGGVLGGVEGGYPLEQATQAAMPIQMRDGEAQNVNFNTEGYATIRENDFLPAIDNPLSTFSIDVDTAAYANTRRFLNQNSLPPVDAVRIEELINYFAYDYELPEGDTPFAIHSELCAAPWDPKHKLVMVALQGKDLVADELPLSNLVFLLDVSGSMDEPNKLPLLKETLKMLANNLANDDRVAIVVYAGAAGLVLPSTSANKKETIIAAIDRLQAGGSTAGGAGINLAYQLAVKHFIKGGNNRVILATDGDFNIGASSDAEMERLIESKREQGIFLSVLGFGMGNYKDSKMEILADKGNGNYAYIDSLIEAKKVLTHDLRKTLFTIAKDVKIQVEFNPAKVGFYRLIGYENRMLKKEDFRDDKKDAGEIGAGHSVTVFYEIIPTDPKKQNIEQLKYQDTRIKDSAKDSRELLTVRVRYKNPDMDTSLETSEILKDKDQTIADVSKNMRFASAVAEFGLLLRDSQYKGQASFDQLIGRARASMDEDPYGYRHEFVRLAEIASILIRNRK